LTIIIIIIIIIKKALISVSHQGRFGGGGTLQ